MKGTRLANSPLLSAFLFVAIDQTRAQSMTEAEAEQSQMQTEERLCGFNGCSFPWDHPMGGLTGGHEVRIHPQ